VIRRNGILQIWSIWTAKRGTNTTADLSALLAAMHLLRWYKNGMTMWIIKTLDTARIFLHSTETAVTSEKNISLILQSKHYCMYERILSYVMFKVHWWKLSSSQLPSAINGPITGLSKIFFRTVIDDRFAELGWVIENRVRYLK
jgi:hypothetical protein